MSEPLLPILLDARRAVREGPAGIERRQRGRLASLVAFARARSPFYRELYRDLPGRIEDSSLLPVTRKADLLARFDEWVTDRNATWERVSAFVANPALIGQPFLGRYTAATTSGTTGTRGTFLADRRATRVRDALLGRALLPALTPRLAWRLLRGGLRTAAVLATGGHFAGLAGALGRAARTDRVRVVSVHLPAHEIAGQLAAFRPAVLAGYAGTIARLAGEQEAGRLHLNLALVLLAAEGLSPAEEDRVSRSFDATTRNLYAATECLHLAASCAHGWLHVNADWVVVEPVDADDRPVPPGTPSHSVLVSNLANRVQPILRYDLGDSVIARANPCACGSPLPALRVQGRAADALTFPAPRGGTTTLASLALASVLERTPGVARYQIAQTEPATLSVRLQVAPAASDDGVWRAVRTDLTSLLAAHGLDQVTIERAQEAPMQNAGGKFRTILPLERRA